MRQNYPEVGNLKKRVLSILVVFALCLQIFIGVATNPIANSQIVNKNTNTISQDYGSRLNPEDYTNHVPFVIDGTTDFGYLGWPGSGTAGDPYVISGLNITGHHDAAIWVMNTDAYFVIVDCFINQIANEVAIGFVNTSHGRVEYVTVEGFAGVGCNNANNTILQHLSLQTTENSLYIIDSANCYVFENNVVSTDLFCLFGEFSPYMLVEQNVFSDVNHMDASAALLNCNHSIVRSNLYPQVLMGPGFRDCYNITVMNEIIFADEIGMGAFDCLDIEFLGCEITTLGESGIQLENADNATVTDCVVSAPGDYGIFAEFSRNVNISNCEVTGQFENGVYLDSCDYAAVSNNTIEGGSFVGIWLLSSLNPTIVGNVLQGAWVGLYVFACDFVEVSSNHVTDSYFAIYVEYSDGVNLIQNYAANSKEVGVGLRNCENFTIADNLIENIELAGIVANHEDDGYNGSIYRNSITNSSGGIIVSNLNRIRIINNTISHLYGMIITFGVGINIGYCDFLTIEGNEIVDANYGIVLDRSRHSVVESNSVEAALMAGIWFTNSQNISVFTNELQHCTLSGIVLSSELLLGIPIPWDTSSHIENNTLIGCGFGFDFDELSDYYRQDFSNNTINGKPFYYGLGQSNLNVQGTSYGQIVLANCTDLNVNSTGYDYENVVTYVDYSSKISLDGIRCRKPFIAIDVENSQNVTIMNSEIERTDVPASLLFFVKSSPLIVVYNCQNATILDSYVKGNDNGVGVYLYNSQLSMVVNCTFLNLYGGIKIGDAPSSTLVENLIIDSQYGIYCSLNYHENQDLTVTKNEIYHCALAGISMYKTDANGSLIQENIIESCGIGIELTDTNVTTIKNNTIRWNSEYGIYMTGSTVYNVSYNIIALSGIENGYDNQMQYWDDNSSQVGNWYDDYSGTGVYPISGGAGAQDRYPMMYTVTEPIIDSPLDIYYAEGSTGNQITWLPYDDYLRDWQVTIDGVITSADAWNFDNATANVDGLDYGTHTVIITVWDVHDNNVTDTVLVHVYDATPPIMNRPPDRVAFVDATGQVITWEVADLHPSEYELLVNDEGSETGTWSSGELEINIDGYTEGVYEFTLIVSDIDGNEKNDTVIVKFVVDNEGPTINSPDDISMNYGEVGNQIVWIAEDEYPATYSITMNGTTLVTNDWGGSRIVLDLDGLSPGTYDFELVVVDSSGLTASDSVRVTILRIPYTPPITPPSFDSALILVLGATVGIVIVVVVVVILKKRSSG